jgi:hypothetical protein
MNKLNWMTGAMSLLAVSLLTVTACGEIDDPQSDAGDMADAGDMSDAGDMCTENSDCPDNQVCDTSGEMGECIPIEDDPEYTFVQIKDMGADAHEENTCSEDDPGADMFAAQLLDSEGNNLGFGRTIDFNEQGDNNVYTNASTVFDGNDPGLMEFTNDNDNTAMCPAPQEGSKFREDSVVSLGCNGALVLAFQNDEDNDEALEAGQQLQLREYGGQCCASPDACPDEYFNATICSAESADEIVGQSTGPDGNFPTCDNTTVFGNNGARGDAIGTIEESMLPEDSSSDSSGN